MSSILSGTEEDAGALKRIKSSTTKSNLYDL